MKNVKVILWGLGAMGGGIGKMLAKKQGVDIVGAIPTPSQETFMTSWYSSWREASTSSLPQKRWLILRLRNLNLLRN